MENNSRRILLTGDDFGRNAEINAAVEQWHRAGAINQASVMVNEPGAEDAAAIARANPGLRVGLHLTLCDGRSSDGGSMKKSPTVSGLAFAFFPGARVWIRREAAAQFERFLALGFAPGHWDGHTHLHLHPTVLAVTLPIAVAHGFRFVRLMREPYAPGHGSGLVRIFSALSFHAAPRLRAAGIGFSDAVFGLRKSGRMDLVEVRRGVRCSREKLTEIYFHPGAETHLRDPSEVAGIVAEGVGEGETRRD